MDISVIIPTYKPNIFLFECLESFEKQTFPKEQFEIILILNGERYPYETQIKNWLTNCKINVQYLYLEEAGVSAARNKGLEKAHSKYIVYVDSDDWVSEEYLEKLFVAAEQSGGFSVSNVILCDSKTKSQIRNKYIDGLFKNNQEKKEYNHKILHKYFSFPWAKMLPIESCRKASFDAHFSYGEDALYMFAIEPYLKNGSFSDDSAVYYKREVTDSLSRTKRHFSENARIHLKLLVVYWQMYFSNIKKYSAYLFIRRNIALLLHILQGK